MIRLQTVLLLLLAISCGGEESCNGVSSRDECVLGSLDTEEKLAAAFGAGAVDFRVQHSMLVSGLPKQERTVTLCTQGSLDRLARWIA